VGKAVITTEVVTVMTAQPPEAGMVYVTIYVPGVLETGVIAPVTEFSVNPAGAAE
jgi:hypothetical protein